jgi:hypothetical protein
MPVRAPETADGVTVETSGRAPETPDERMLETSGRVSQTPGERAAALPIKAPEALTGMGKDISEEEADEGIERVVILRRGF